MGRWREMPSWGRPESEARRMDVGVGGAGGLVHMGAPPTSLAGRWGREGTPNR